MTAPHASSRRPALERRWLTLTLTAIGLYSVWVLAPWIGTSLDPVTTFISELAARDQPHSWIYRTADLLAGTALLVLGVILHRSGRHRTEPASPLLAWAGLALAVMGAATMADSQLALSCAPQADPVCLANEVAGTVPLAHKLHTWSSALAGAALLAAVAMVTLWWSHPARRRWWVVALGVLTLAADLLSGVLALTGGPLGASQRLALLVFGIFLPLALHLRPGRTS